MKTNRRDVYICVCVYRKSSLTGELLLGELVLHPRSQCAVKKKSVYRRSRRRCTYIYMCAKVKRTGAGDQFVFTAARQRRSGFAYPLVSQGGLFHDITAGLIALGGMFGAICAKLREAKELCERQSMYIQLQKVYYKDASLALNMHTGAFDSRFAIRAFIALRGEIHFSREISACADI